MSNHNQSNDDTSTATTHVSINYICPECDGGFNTPVDVTETKSAANPRNSTIAYEGKGCPWCGEMLSETRRQIPQDELASGE